MLEAHMSYENNRGSRIYLVEPQPQHYKDHILELNLQILNLENENKSLRDQLTELKKVLDTETNASLKKLNPNTPSK